ncbi:MAG: putative ribosomal small subunit methyltransferase [Bacilli bacterium]|nr:putative ribosomal small subunit methyltransferase [Bacilli bacterium]
MKKQVFVSKFAEQLPTEFLNKMNRLLGAEFDDFVMAYEMPPTKGLRVNLLKTTDRFVRENLIPQLQLRPVPWCKSGFYYNEQASPGKSALHQAGAYYIQEPSAMYAAELLRPKPGTKVLDLCAAPGGKTTHLAAFLASEGILVANEPYAKRCAVLVENLERLGVKNALVTQNEPHELSAVFSEWFDHVLVDAPCSGEGMFRKEPGAISEWSQSQVEHCRQRQQKILTEAANMLRPGGTFVYSTCTFSPEENEQVISAFLGLHPEFQLLPGGHPALSAGRADWAARKEPSLNQTVRIWPHLQKGEGHYLALLTKTESTTREVRIQQKREKRAQKPTALPHVKQWMDDQLQIESGGFLSDEWQKRNQRSLMQRGDHIYLAFHNLPADVRKLHLMRPGFWLGELKRNRFEPSHSLAAALDAGDARQTFEADDQMITRYLHGETLQFVGPPGWVLILYQGLSIGWAKNTAGVLKNHFPKGLRR